jgi:cytoskeleton protein RodZ
LLELFPEQSNDDTQPMVRESGAAEWIRRRPGLVLSLLALLVVALLAGLAALIWPEEGIESLWRPSEAPAVTIPPADSGDEWGWSEEGTDPARPEAAAGDAAVETSVAEAPTDAAVVDGAEPDAPSGSDGSALPAGVGSAVVEGTSESGSEPGVRRITATGDQRLRLDFSADSWVEIRDPEGAVLYSNLNRAGTGLELVGQGPFRILLGYAPGVTLAFEGEPVALAPHTRNNVATLVLGQ